MTERAFADVDLTVEQGDEFLRLVAETSTLPVAPAGPLPTHAACPFCGSIPTEMDGYDCDPPIFWVECSRAVGTNCIAGPQRESPEAAWQAWNTRTATADVTQLVEEVLTHMVAMAIWLPSDDGVQQEQRLAARYRERLARALAGQG